MSDEQRERVRAKSQTLAQGPHSRRLQSAARDATGSVANVAVSAVEEVADRVSNVADDVATKISSDSKVSSDS
jgi:hypothetical protein